ncbi:MAG TPA: DinB family protein, partial [Verrucomicrobiae bacterium]|nr:DinB family protein [Verrucomicrobiae bacterium]
MMNPIAEVMTAARTHRATHQDNTSTAIKLQEQYRRIRNLTERLSEPLETEDYVIQSMPEASPVKWHLAHTTWFFEAFVLSQLVPSYQPVASAYGYLFNSYYNALGPMHCRDRRGLLSRPTVKETFEYRRRVDEQMQSLMESLDEGAGDQLAALVTLGLNHEQQHQELLLTDIKHAFGQNPLYPAYHPRRPVPDRTVPELSWESYPEGIFWIGQDGGGFAYDNEGPRHRQFVAPFALASRLVTNEEYLAFIEDGGYHCPQWWLSLGWQTATQQR